MTLTDKLGIGATLGAVLLILTGLAGMITHIVVCLKAGTYLLLIAGAIAVPVGVIHGIGAWFGWWS